MGCFEQTRHLIFHSMRDGPGCGEPACDISSGRNELARDDISHCKELPRDKSGFEEAARDKFESQEPARDVPTAREGPGCASWEGPACDEVPPCDGPETVCRPPNTNAGVLPSSRAR